MAQRAQARRSISEGNIFCRTRVSETGAASTAAAYQGL